MNVLLLGFIHGVPRLVEAARAWPSALSPCLRSLNSLYRPRAKVSSDTDKPSRSTAVAQV
jgi:hypothetical protein